MTLINTWLLPLVDLSYFLLMKDGAQNAKLIMAKPYILQLTFPKLLLSEATEDKLMKNLNLSSMSYNEEETTFEFKIPTEYNTLVGLFLQGKYSAIPLELVKEAYGEDPLMIAVVKKAPHLREALEERLGIPIDEFMEVESAIKPNDEDIVHLNKL